MATTTHYRLYKPIVYDRAHHRVWIFGQRCHHGATGTVLTLAGALGLILMAHDWKDRGVWFVRGWQEE